MSRIVNLNSELQFDEIFKAVEISNLKTTGYEHKSDFLHVLPFNRNIQET